MFKFRFWRYLAATLVGLAIGISGLLGWVSTALSEFCSSALRG